MPPKRLLIVLVVALIALGCSLLAGCGDDQNGSAAPAATPVPVDEVEDSGYDADGEYGQDLYDEAFTASYSEACTWIFQDSPDGYLYSSGDQYDESDCAYAEPTYPEWDGSDDPEVQGQSEGWDSACEETFYAVGDDLYWGDDEVAVSETDCQLANPY